MEKGKSIEELRVERSTLYARIDELTFAIRRAKRELTAEEEEELHYANLRCTEINDEVNTSDN
ncbi:MAG: hypothetical protein LBB27_03050 [Tannerellaceae bacterium]|nr:hypothetical protein [Tannerellaceae bacterium]